MCLVMSTETLNMAIMTGDMSRAWATASLLHYNGYWQQNLEILVSFNSEKWTKCVAPGMNYFISPPICNKTFQYWVRSNKTESNWILGSALLSSVSGLIFLKNWCCFGSKIFHILLPAINSSRTKPKLSFVTTAELLIWRKWTHNPDFRDSHEYLQKQV